MQAPVDCRKGSRRGSSTSAGINVGGRERSQTGSEAAYLFRVSRLRARSASRAERSSNKARRPCSLQHNQAVAYNPLVSIFMSILVALQSLLLAANSAAVYNSICRLWRQDKVCPSDTPCAFFQWRAQLSPGHEEGGQRPVQQDALVQRLGEHGAQELQQGQALGQARGRRLRVGQAVRGACHQAVVRVEARLDHLREPLACNRSPRVSSRGHRCRPQQHTSQWSSLPQAGPSHPTAQPRLTAPGVVVIGNLWSLEPDETSTALFCICWFHEGMPFRSSL